MMSKQATAAVTLALAFGGLSGPQAASSQLTAASPSVLGTANNYSALARGFTAIALNPARLAMPGNPGFSLTFLPVEAKAGLSGMKLSEIAAFDNMSIPASVRQEWLNSVIEDGGFELRTDVSATGLALSIGPVGLQISPANSQSVVSLVERIMGMAKAGHGLESHTGARVAKAEVLSTFIGAAASSSAGRA